MFRPSALSASPTAHAWSYPVLQCTACRLRAGCKSPIPGEGPGDADFMLVGEAPGRNEDKHTRNFIGMAGAELDNYLKRNNLIRARMFISNTVKCKPPEDRDPQPDELEACIIHLHEEIQRVRPKVIAAMGAVACRALLGEDFRLDRDHGIPRPVCIHTFGYKSYEAVHAICVPMYHPALGLHSTLRMTDLFRDFAVLSATMRHELRPVMPDERDEFPDPAYSLAEDPDVLELYTSLSQAPFIGVDTETQADGSPLFVSISCAPGTGLVIRADNPVCISWLADFLGRSTTTTILHNALFDLRVLDRLGIVPSHVYDSMVAAYILQTEPQGLKALAYRHAGMFMRDYADMVRGATRARYVEYFEKIVSMEWPKPDPELVWDKGTPRIKQPQGVNTRVNRILKDMDRDSSVDPVGRWDNFSSGVQAMIENVLGPLHPCDLDDIDAVEAIWYSARDADATFRVWPYLYNEIVGQGLLEAFEVDMQIAPMVLDMMRVGMLVDIDGMQELSIWYQQGMDNLQTEIEQIAGHPVNPGSSPQVAALLYGELEVCPPNMTKAGNPSVDEEILQGLVGKHPVVKKILDWRSLAKNKDSFADTIPHKVRKDGRIHADIKTTRVYTGRLSCSEPNLMAIPIRTEEGKRIRSQFIAEDGCILISGDFSQIEMRLVCHEARDPEMTKIFKSGEDIHARTASIIFGVPVDKLDKMKHRYPAKRVGFGVLNHLGPEGLLDQLVLAGCEGWTVDRCAELIREWFTLFRGIDSLFKSVKAEARRTGKVRDLFGRSYRVPEVWSSLNFIREAGDRQACSYIIQGGAQGIMKRGMRDMIPVYKSFRSMGVRCNPLIQIHDDLVWEVDCSVSDSFSDVLKYTMEGCVKLSIPLILDTHRGTNWGEL